MVSMNRLTTEKRAADHRLPRRGHLHPRHRPHDRRREEHRRQAAGRSRRRVLRRIRTACCATCRARRSSATRSGRSATPSRRTSPRSTGARSATATCGRGRRSTPTPSSCRRGSSVSAPRDDCWTFLMHDLRDRLAGRIQLTTDGAFQLPRRPSASRSAATSTTRSCSRCTARPEGGPDALQPADLHRHRRSHVIAGRPDPAKISTSATSSGRTSRCGWGCAASRA